MEHNLVRTNQEFEDFLKSFDFRIFAFDLETTGLNVRQDKIIGISFSNAQNLSFYIPLGKYGLDRDYIFNSLRDKFETSDLVIGHNIKFDLKFINKWIDYNNLKIFDTMVAHCLINENVSHGLKPLARIYLGAKTESFDDISKNYKNFEEIPVEKIYTYACNDAKYTFELYKVFKYNLEEEQLISYFNKIEMPFLKIIIEMELHGVRIDERLLDFYIMITSNRINELKTIIHKRLNTRYQLTLLGELNYDLNLDSGIQLGKKLFQEFEPSLFTEKGTPKVNIEHFELLYNKYGDLLFQNLIEYSKLKKLYNAYLIPYKLKLEENRLFFDVLQHIAVTGRLSSKNPNIMQLPRPKTYNVYGEEIEIRKLFLPDEGFKIVAGDYAQEELRLAAVIADETNMYQEFDAGFDMHLAAANRVFKLGLNPEALKEKTVEYEVAKKLYKKERQNAKAISFGLLYGKTSKGFAETLKISEEDADKMVNDYFGAYPSIKRAIDKTIAEVKVKGFVTDLFGRKRRFIKINNEYYDKRSLRQAFNFKVQGSAASLLKLVCVKIKEQLPDFKILFTVHDEIVLQTKQNYLNNLKYLIENVVKLPVSLPSDLKIGSNYYEVK